MAAGTAVTARKSYKITNWKQYNESLVRRGDVTFWFSDEVVSRWHHDNAQVRHGHPFFYSDLAIETLLTIRELFRLPYRQTEGLGRALAQLMNADVPIPDYTSLQKRAAKLGVNIRLGEVRGPIDVVVDSTGLKVFGEGEWKVRQHGVDKRRTWRKLHLSVNPDTREIVAQLLTENSGHDADQVQPLLAQTPEKIKMFFGDGAYDQEKVYHQLAERGIDPIIPPRVNAVIHQHGNSAATPLPRDEAIRLIHRAGKAAWKEQIGYHRRSLVETTMYRLKSAFGDKLKNRTLPNQITEAALRCKILNAFVAFGLPAFVWG